MALLADNTRIVIPESIQGRLLMHVVISNKLESIVEPELSKANGALSKPNLTAQLSS